MGNKGDKLTANSSTVANSIVTRLKSIDGITSKKMFGGHGIFHEGKMFGIIDSKGAAFFKVDDSNKSDFEKTGGQQHSKMPYYSLPEAILNEPEELVKWAKKSIKINK